MGTLVFVANLEELIENIRQLERWVQDPESEDGTFALELIKRGICFVVVESGGSPFFAPSRFIGYKDNTRPAHQQNPYKDGRDTNEVITSLLGRPAKPDPNLDNEYQRFCRRLGIQPRSKGPFGITRKFWDLR